VSVPSRLPVDARLLEPLVVLAEELHFTRAAERLHVAQPALSQQIGRLERQLGVVLFDRPPKVVALTPAGTVLLERVRPALADLRRAVDEARAVAAGTRGVLRLVHLSSFGPGMVPGLVRALAGAAPGLKLVSREASVEEQLEALAGGTADVGLFYRDATLALPLPTPTSTIVEPIAEGPHYVALREDHPAVARAVAGVLPLEALADEAWILPTGTTTSGYQASFFLAMCARHGFTPRVVQEANRIETMLALVVAGFGIAPAPWLTHRRRPPGVVFLRTPGERFAIVAARRAGTEPRPADGVLLAVARQVARAILDELPEGHAPARSAGNDPVLDGGAARS
jgi:DNA-binding transcriptional LysR family regulator